MIFRYLTKEWEDLVGEEWSFVLGGFARIRISPLVGSCRFFSAHLSTGWSTIWMCVSLRRVTHISCVYAFGFPLKPNDTHTHTHIWVCRFVGGDPQIAVFLWFPTKTTTKTRRANSNQDEPHMRVCYPASQGFPSSNLHGPVVVRSTPWRWILAGSPKRTPWPLVGGPLKRPHPWNYVAFGSRSLLPRIS